jgi:hypothetical protein
MYHLEEGHCHRISAIEFKGYLQHKGIIKKLLEDPTLLEKMKEKDMHSWYESARDDSTAGGVSLLECNDEDITWDEELIEPTRPTIAPSMPANKQTWPSLNNTNALTKAMGDLSMKKADVGAWGTGNTSKELFPAATATPATDEWQKRTQDLEAQNSKSNILSFQFWNPNHQDFDPNRFYDPIIEQHCCPFPACDEYFDTHADCQQ